MKTEISTALDRLYQQKGALRTADVVEAATPETSPLHGEFEWDDGAAGHAYRLFQARHLIRACVVITPEDRSIRHVYVSIEHTSDPRYLRLADLAQEPNLWGIAMSGARMHLSAAERQVNELEAVAVGASQRSIAQRARRGLAHVGRVLAATPA